MPLSHRSPPRSRLLLSAIAVAAAGVGAWVLLRAQEPPPPTGTGQIPATLEAHGTLVLKLETEPAAAPSGAPGSAAIQAPSLERGIYRTLFERGHPDEVGVDALLLTPLPSEHTENCPKGICVQNGRDAADRMQWALDALGSGVDGVVAAPYIPIDARDALRRVFQRHRAAAAAGTGTTPSGPLRVFGFSQLRPEMGEGRRTVAIAVYDHADVNFDGPEAAAARRGGTLLLVARLEGPPDEQGRAPLLAGVVQIEERSDAPTPPVPETPEAVAVHRTVGGLYTHFTTARGQAHRFCFTEGGKLLYFPPGGKPAETLPPDGALARALRALIDRV